MISDANQAQSSQHQIF